MELIASRNRNPLGPGEVRTVEQTDWQVTIYEMPGYASNCLKRGVPLMNFMVDRRMAVFSSIYRTCYHHAKED